MAGVLTTGLSLVVVAVASIVAALFLRRERSEAWKKFAVFAVACLAVASVLFVFFMLNFV